MIKLNEPAVKKKTAVLGGDCRQFYVAKRLAGCGFDVSLYGFCAARAGIDIADAEFTVDSGFPADTRAAFADYDIFVLPLPLSSDNVRLNAPFCGDYCEMRLRTLFDSVPDGATVFAGKVSDAAGSYAEAHGIRLTDYFKREDLQIKNAVPTAEGALEIAIRELPVTLMGLQCAVTGYGRVGCVLARLLRAVGADVTVYARSMTDRARAVSDGMKAADLYRLAEPSAFRVLFNTVPFPIIKEPQLAAMGQDTVLIDLAASPGGVDTAAAKALGRKVVWALSLPGKTSPQTAGEIIGDTVADILREGGDKGGAI